MARRHVGYRQRGVTLIEVAFAVVIVAVGVTAVMGFFASASKSSSQLEELNTGIVLATSAHNWANNQPYDSDPTATPNPIVGMDTWTTTPPTGPAIQSEWVNQGWTQTFTVQRLSTTNLLTSSTDTEHDECLRVTVVIKKGTRTIYTASRIYAPGFR